MRHHPWTSSRLGAKPESCSPSIYNGSTFADQARCAPFVEADEKHPFPITNSEIGAVTF